MMVIRVSSMKVMKMLTETSMLIATFWTVIWQGVLPGSPIMIVSGLMILPGVAFFWAGLIGSPRAMSPLYKSDADTQTDDQIELIAEFEVLDLSNWVAVSVTLVAMLLTASASEALQTLGQIMVMFAWVILFGLMSAGFYTMLRRAFQRKHVQQQQAEEAQKVQEMEKVQKKQKDQSQADEESVLTVCLDLKRSVSVQEACEALEAILKDNGFK